MHLAFIRTAEAKDMLKISVIDNRTQRRLILEGKLISPWTAELRTFCEKLRADLDERELVINIKHLTAISQEGENLLLELMKEGVRFRSQGLFTKQVLSQLTRRLRKNMQGMER
ncbi:MAG TPA: hypothetical protein VNX88_05000 [Terriglobales bacterium]|nr:hypothetical protein [Terriglobales bacterium]